MCWRSKGVKGAILLLITGILSGCWDNRDINHRALPVVMGIGLHDDLYEVILQIPSPETDEIQMKILTQKGRTINEAVEKMSERLESRIDLLHLKVIMVEQDYALQGLNDSISSFMRARDISPKALVVICGENLDHFFDQIRNSVAAKGTTLYDCFEKNAGWNPQMALTRLWQVYRSIHSFTRDVALPIYKSGENGTVAYSGSAIIKNGKMVDTITPEETLLFNSVTGESGQGKIEVMDSASVLILDNSMKRRTSMRNGVPHMAATLTMKVTILETRGTTSSQEIKKQLQEILSSKFKSVLKKSQQSEADIMGLGQYYRSKLPRKELRVWRSEYLPELVFDLKVVPIIQNEGNLKLP